MRLDAGRILIAVACLLHGAFLTLSDAQAYRSPTYRILFTEMPAATQVRWGILFVAAGVAGLTLPAPWRTFITATVLTTWALGLFAAVLTGDATSRSAPIWPAVVAAIVVAYGARPQPGRR